MTKFELQKYLESYQYDLQFVQEKIKEEERINKMMQTDADLQFIAYNKQHGQEQIKKILDKKCYIENMIQDLKQPYVNVLYLKYICFYTFDQVAGKMNYSTKRIYQLHNEALNKVLENLQKQNV